MQLDRVLWTFGFLLFFAALWVCGQEQPASAPPPAAPEGAVSAPVLENRGQPIRLPYTCSADDIQWAGLSCSEDDPCAVFLELSAAEGTGSRIVVAGNLHAEAVTLYSVLLASDDDGRTWTEVHARMRGAALDRIQFLDTSTGWISGEELFPLPQNPFLMLTTDGGKSWSRRPVFNEAGEEHYGMVQQFVFSDKEHGNLIVDRGQSGSGHRYTLYESRVGGETWNIVQESDKPLRLKQSAPESAWRVRVDAASQSYRVEHRQGERWSAVAAFGVKLNPCK